MTFFLKIYKKEKTSHKIQTFLLSLLLSLWGQWCCLLYSDHMSQIPEGYPEIDSGVEVSDTSFTMEEHQSIHSNYLGVLEGILVKGISLESRKQLRRGKQIKLIC